MNGSGSVWSLLEARVAATPEGLFGVDERGGQMSYADLYDRCCVAAAGLADLGVHRGSVVSWQLPNTINAAVLMLALCRLEAVQNPLIPILRRREVEFICGQAGTDLLIVPGSWRNFDYREMADSIAAQMEGMSVLVVEGGLPSGDPARLAPRRSDAGAAWYFYTSGTTADPKGAIHSDRSLIAAARGYYTRAGYRSSDRFAMVMPVTHVGGAVHVIVSVETGGAQVFIERFDPEITPRQLRDQEVTILPGGVPFVRAYLDFADRHPELDPLFPAARMMIHGGSPKPPHLNHEVKKRFGLAGIVSSYGMTECPMAVCGADTDPPEEMATTEGRPVPTIDLIIVDASGERVAVGLEGEVRLKGAQLMSGYVDPALQKDSFDDSGYFRSGDLGRLDEKAYLTITGRLKDIIIRNTENISASEVENLLFSHPKVAEVAVIGVPDEVTGERVCAVVVPADPADPPSLEDIDAHLMAVGLSRQKVPERLELIDHLPRNAMEKVLKADLRRLILSGGRALS